MSQRSVRFETIEVQRVLGIGQGEDFALADLSPGVNLIHGPNGSGKTTTARVIQELLWPGWNGLGRPTVAGRFVERDVSWHVSIDAGHAEFTADGESGAVPPVGPPENRHCYNVALHELIVDDNAIFAKTVANLIQGGFDLEAAEQALGFDERPPMPRKQAAMLKQAHDAVQEATRRQRAIEESARQINDLRERRDRAARAEVDVKLLEKARDHQEAKEKCAAVNLHLAALPEGVSLLQGDEREVLDKLQSDRGELEADLGDEQRTIEEAQKELQELNLPEEGVGRDFVATLRSGQRRLNGVENEIRQQRSNHHQAETEAARARKRLGEHLSDEQLEALESVEIDDLSNFARRADRVRAERQVLEETRRSLEQQQHDEVEDVDEQAIRDGIAALRQWLTLPAPAAWPTLWPTIVALVLLIALACLLGFLHHWGWFLFIAMAPALFVWDWRLRESRARLRSAERAVHRQSYEATALAPPSEWEEGAVLDRLRSLSRLADVRAREDERLRRLNELRADETKTQKLQDDLDATRRDAMDRLGLKIEIADEWLPLLIDNVAAWQRCSTKVAVTDNELARLEEEQRALWAEMNEGLQPFAYEAVDAAETAAQLIEDLDERRMSQRTAVKVRDDARTRIADVIEPRLAKVSSQRQEALARLGLLESEERRVDDWLAERPKYLELTGELKKQAAIQEHCQQALAEHVALLELSRTEIQQRIDELQLISAERDDLNQQIAGIERDVHWAKTGHDLADALEARDAAAAALADARDECGLAVVGAALSRWVRAEAVDKSRPVVFERASKLLVELTRGALELELDDRTKPPTFRARRGPTPTCSLDELSIGERVQLLMAVRVAFLEHDEVTRLPLLLDEVLGTTDDDRAGVIIDTVMDVARQGRQVFYFTAQQDEVGKWVARLRGSDLPNKVIDLAEVRRLRHGAAAPLQIATVDVPKPLAPDGLNHADYGQVLGVSIIDPAVEHLDNVHLWHLIDDVELLHQLLCRRINTWGQLRTLLRHGGAGLVHADQKQFERAEIIAKAIAEACQAWRIGRGRPVDRGALIDSGCVSGAFISEVAELARSVNGDAEAVLDALENQRVKRWRTENTGKLREHFLDNGFLSGDTPKTAEEIRVRIQATIANELRDGRIEESLIERILGQLPNLPKTG